MNGGGRHRLPLLPTRDRAEGPGTAGTHGEEPALWGAGDDCLTAPCPGEDGDGSARCVLGAARSRRLATLRRGRGVADAGRPGMRPGSPCLVRTRFSGAVIISTRHAEPMVGSRRQRLPTMFFICHRTRFLAFRRRRRRERRGRWGGVFASADSQLEDGVTGSARRTSPLAWVKVGGRSALGLGARHHWRAAAAAARTGYSSCEARTPQSQMVEI